MDRYVYWCDNICYEEIDGVVRSAHRKGDGIHRTWYANGQLEYEYTRVDGRYVGISRHWHDNGVLESETPHHLGFPHGVVRHWNRKGVLLGAYELKMGFGISRTWNEDGSLVMESNRINEHAETGTVWDDLRKPYHCYLWNGKPISKKKFYERLAREEEENSK